MPYPEEKDEPQYHDEVQLYEDSVIVEYDRDNVHISVLDEDGDVVYKLLLGRLETSGLCHALLGAQLASRELHDDEDVGELWVPVKDPIWDGDEEADRKAAEEDERHFNEWEDNATD